MPDRPSASDDDRYRWLYGDAARGGVPDSDATQRIAPADPRTPPPAEPDRPRASTHPDGRTGGHPGGQPSGHGQQTGQKPLPPLNLPPPGRPVAAGSRSSDRSSSRRPRSKARTVRHVLLAVVLVWVLFLVLVPIWAWSTIEKVDASPDGVRPADQPGATYLIVGSDSREGLSDEEQQELATGDVDGQRTDTIMVLHTGDGPTTLLSLPRDSPVEIPGYGTGKINAAFAYDGPELLVETVELSTGIRVDGYVEIGLGGFVNVVDALGGVQICPDAAITDPKAGLDIAEGCQQADGPTALGYARTRDFAIADLQRVQNQREVVSAVADDTASPWTVLNPWRYFRLASAGADALRIGDDVGPVDLARFAWAMGGVSGGGKTCTVPLASADATWDADRAEQLFRLIRADRTDEISKDLCQANGLAG